MSDQKQIRKQFNASIARQDGTGDRVRTFTISTESPDRDNDTIAVAGWKLDHYRKNPVVLWAHDYSQLPLAKAIQVGVQGDRLIATAEFADHAMANTVLQLIDGGFLRATSVGFRPIRAEPNMKRGGTDFMEQELLEFSVVPVPANPEAVIGLRSIVKQLIVEPGTDDAVLIIDDEQIEVDRDGVVAAVRSVVGREVARHTVRVRGRLNDADALADPAVRHRAAVGDVVFDVDDVCMALAAVVADRQWWAGTVRGALQTALDRRRGRID